MLKMRIKNQILLNLFQKYLGIFCYCFMYFINFVLYIFITSLNPWTTWIKLSWPLMVRRPHFVILRDRTCIALWRWWIAALYVFLQWPLLRLPEFKKNVSQHCSFFSQASCWSLVLFAQGVSNKRDLPNILLPLQHRFQLRLLVSANVDTLTSIPGTGAGNFLVAICPKNGWTTDS
jgi:hypothetical protein